MQIAIREDFSGLGMWCHREDLVMRLDHVLEQLDLGIRHLRQYKPGLGEWRIQLAKERYEGLKAELLDVDGEAMNTLTRTFSN